MKILVLGALVVLLNLPVSEAHSILRIKGGGKEDTSIISDALGAVEDAFANLKKHQDEMSEHIKDFVVLQDQLDIPEVTKGTTATVKRPHKTMKCHPKRKCHRTMIRRFRFKNGKPIIAGPTALENKINVNASKTGTVNRKSPANRTHLDQHVDVSNQKQYHKTTDTYDSKQQGGKEIREKEIPVPKAKNIENSRVSNVPAEVDTKKKLTPVSNRAPVSIITPVKVQEVRIDNSRSKGFAPGKGVPSTTTNGPVRISGALSEVVPTKKVVVSSTQRVPPKVSGSDSGKSFIQGDLHKPVISKNVPGSQIATKLEDVVVPKKLHPNGQNEESSYQADNHPHHSSNKVDKNGTHHQPTPNAPSNGKTANQPQAAIIKKQDMSNKLATVPTKALSDHHVPPSSLNASTSPNTNKKTTQSSAPNFKISFSRLGNNIPKITDTVLKDTASVSRVPDTLNTKVSLDQKKLKEVGNSGLKQNLTNIVKPTSNIGEQNGKQIARIHNPLVQSVLNSNQFDSKEHIPVGTPKHPSGGAATNGHNSNQHRITEKLQHPDSSITHTLEKPERKTSRLFHTEPDRSMKNKPIRLNQPPTVESTFPDKITKPFLGEAQVPRAFNGAEVGLNGGDARAGYNQALDVKPDEFSENRAPPGSLDITTSPNTIKKTTVPNSNIGQYKIDDNLSKIADTAFVGPVADQLNTQPSLVHKKLKDVGGSHLKEHFAAGKAGAVDDVKLPSNNLVEQKGKHLTADYTPRFESVLNPINYEPSKIATPAVEPFNVKDAVSDVVDNTDHFPLGSTKYVSGDTIGDRQLSDHPKEGNVKNTNSMRDNPERQDTNPSTLEHGSSTETKPNRFNEQTTEENNFPDTSNIHLIPDKFGKKPFQNMLEHGSHSVTPDSRQLEDSTEGVYISKAIDLPANVQSRPHSLSSTRHLSIGSDTPTHLNGAQEQRISDKNELTPNSKDADIAAAEIGNSEDANYDPSIQDSNVGPGQSGEMEPDEFNESSEEAEEKGTLRGSSFDEEKSPYQKKSGGDGGSHVPIALAKEEDIFSTKVNIPTPNIQHKLYDTIASDMRTVKTGVSMEPIELNDSVTEKNTHPETNTLKTILLDRNQLVGDDISTTEHKDLINKSDNFTDDDRMYAKLHDNIISAAKQSIHSKESIAHDASTSSGDAAVADEDERTNMKHQGDAHTSRKPESQTISDSTPRPNPFIGLDGSNDSDASMNTYPDTIHKKFNPNNYMQIAPSDQKLLEHSSHAIQEDIVRPTDYATEDLISKKLDIPDYTNTPVLNRKLDDARIPDVLNRKESTNVKHPGVTDTSREPESQHVSAFTPKSSPSVEIDPDEFKDSAASLNTYPDTVHTNFNTENYMQMAQSYQKQKEDGSDTIQEDIVRPTDNVTKDHTSKNLDIPDYTNTPALNRKLDDERIPDVFNSKESTNMKHQGVADTSRKPESQTISASTPKPNPSTEMKLDEFKDSAASINTYPDTIHTNFNPENYMQQAPSYQKQKEDGSDAIQEDIVRPTDHVTKDHISKNLHIPDYTNTPALNHKLEDARIPDVFNSKGSTNMKHQGVADTSHEPESQTISASTPKPNPSIGMDLDEFKNSAASINTYPHTIHTNYFNPDNYMVENGSDGIIRPEHAHKLYDHIASDIPTSKQLLGDARDGELNSEESTLAGERDHAHAHDHSMNQQENEGIRDQDSSMSHKLDKAENQPRSHLIPEDDESIETEPNNHVSQTPESSTKTVPSGQDSKSSPVSNSKHDGLLKPSRKTENEDLDGDTNTPGDIDDISEGQDTVDHTHLPQPNKHPTLDSAGQSILHKLDKPEKQPTSDLIADDESIETGPARLNKPVVEEKGTIISNTSHVPQTPGSSTKTVPSGQDIKSSPVSSSKHNGRLKPSLKTENEDLDGDTNTPGDIDDISEEQVTVDHTHLPQPKKHPTQDSSGESIRHKLDKPEKHPTSDLITDDESIETGPTRLNKPVVEEKGAIISTTIHVPQTPGSSTKAVPSGQDSKSSPVRNSKHNGLLKPSLKTENEDLDGDTNTPGDIDDIAEEQVTVDHTHLPQPKKHPTLDSAGQNILHKFDKPEKQPTSDLIADDESIETGPTSLNKPVVEEKGAITSTTSHVPQTPGSSTKTVPSDQGSNGSPVHNGLLKPSHDTTENGAAHNSANAEADKDFLYKHEDANTMGQSIDNTSDKSSSESLSTSTTEPDLSVGIGVSKFNKPASESAHPSAGHVDSPDQAGLQGSTGGSTGNAIHIGLANDIAEEQDIVDGTHLRQPKKNPTLDSVGQIISHKLNEPGSKHTSDLIPEVDESIETEPIRINEPVAEENGATVSDTSHIPQTPGSFRKTLSLGQDSNGLLKPSIKMENGDGSSSVRKELEGSTDGSASNTGGLADDISEEQDSVDHAHLPQPKKNPTLDSVGQSISHNFIKPENQPTRDLIPEVHEPIEMEPVRLNEPVSEENGATVSDTSHIPQTPGGLRKTVSLGQDSNGSPVHNGLLKPSIKMENGDGDSSVRKELEDSTDGSPSNTEGLADDSSEEQDTIDHAHLPQRKKNPTLDSVGQSISHKFYKSARPSHDFIPEVDESIEMEPIRVNKPVAEEKSTIPQTPGSSTNTVLSVQDSSKGSPVNSGLLKPSLRMENENIDRGTDTSGHTHINLNPILHDTTENGVDAHNAEADEDLLDQHEDASIMGQNIDDTSGKSRTESSSTYTTQPDLSAGIGFSRFNKPASESAHPRTGHVDSSDQTELEGSTGSSGSKAIHRGLEDDTAEEYDMVDHSRLAQPKKNPSPESVGQSIPRKLNVPGSQSISDRIPEDDESIETEPVRLNYPVAKKKGGIIPTTNQKSVQDSNSSPVSDSQYNGLLKPLLEKNPTLDSSVPSDSNSAEQAFDKTQISNAKKSALDSANAHATHAGKADKYLLERQESPTSKDRSSSVVLDSSRNQTVTPKIDPPSSSIRTGLTTTSNPKLYDDIASNIPNVRTHGAGAVETVENLSDEHENENIEDQDNSIANTYKPNIHSSSDFTSDPDLPVETEPFGPYDPVAKIGGTNPDKSHIRFVPENSMEAHPPGQQQLPDTNGRPASHSVHASLQKPSNNIKNGDPDKDRNTPIVLNPIVHDIFENGEKNAEADQKVIDQQDDASVNHQSTPKIPSKSRNETPDASSFEPNVHIGIRPTRPKKPDAGSAYRRTGHVDFVPDGFDETISPDEEEDSSTGPTSNAINEGLRDNITEDDVNEEHDIVDHAHLSTLTKAAEKSFDRTQTSNADNSKESAQDNINLHSTSNVKADKDLLEQHGSATMGDKSSGMIHTSNESKNQVLSAHNHKTSPGSSSARTGLTTTEDHTPNHELFDAISNDIPAMKQLQRIDKAGTDVSTDGIRDVTDKHLPDEHQDESTEDHGRSQTFSNITPEPDVSTETYPIELDNEAAIKEGANLNKSHIRLAPENSKQAVFSDQGQLEDSNDSPARESVHTDLRKSSNNTNDYLDRDEGTSYTSGSQISSASTSKPASGSTHPIMNQVGHPPDTVKDIESQDQQGKELEDVSNAIHRGHLQLIDIIAEDDINKEHTSPIMKSPALDETIIGATNADKKSFDKTQITNAYNSKGSMLDDIDDATDAVEADKHIQDNNGSPARDSVHAGPLRPLINMENDLDKEPDILAHTYRPPSTLNPIRHDNTDNDGTAHVGDSEEGEYSLNQHKDASINGQSIAHPTSKSRSETSKPNLPAGAGLTELTKAAAESAKPKTSNPGFVPDNFNRIISPIQEDLEDDRGGSASNAIPRDPEHNIDEDQGIVNHTPLTKNPTLVKSITGTKDAAEKAFDKTPILKAYNSKSALDDDSTVDADGVEADEYVLDKPRTLTLNVPNAKSDSARPVDNTTESGLSRKLDVSSHKDSSNDSISSGTPSMKQLQLLDDEETVPSIINNRVSSPSDTSKNADEDTARKGTIGHMHFSPESSIKSASSEKIQKQENNGSISDGDFDHQRPSINVEKDDLDKVSDTHRLPSIMNSSRHDTTHINAGEYDTDEDQHENASIKGQSMADTSGESRSKTSSYEPKQSVGISLTKSTEPAPESAHLRYSSLGIVPDNFNEKVSPDNPKPEHDNRGTNDDEANQYFLDQHENASMKGQSVADTSDKARSKTSSASAYEPKLSVGLTKSTKSAPESVHSRSSHLNIVPDNFNENVSSDKSKLEEDSRGPDDKSGLKKVAENVTEDNVYKEQDIADHSDISSLPKSSTLDKADERSAETFGRIAVIHTLDRKAQSQTFNASPSRPDKLEPPRDASTISSFQNTSKDELGDDSSDSVASNEVVTNNVNPKDYISNDNKIRPLSSSGTRYAAEASDIPTAKQLLDSEKSTASDQATVSGDTAESDGDILIQNKNGNGEDQYNNIAYNSDKSKASNSKSDSSLGKKAIGFHTSSFGRSTFLYINPVPLVPHVFKEKVLPDHKEQQANGGDTHTVPTGHTKLIEDNAEDDVSRQHAYDETVVTDIPVGKKFLKETQSPIVLNSKGSIVTNIGAHTTSADDITEAGEDISDQHKNEFHKDDDKNVAYRSDKHKIQILNASNTEPDLPIREKLIVDKTNNEKDTHVNFAPVHLTETVSPNQKQDHSSAIDSNYTDLVKLTDDITTDDVNSKLFDHTNLPISSLTSTLDETATSDSPAAKKFLGNAKTPSVPESMEFAATGAGKYNVDKYVDGKEQGRSRTKGQTSNALTFEAQSSQQKDLEDIGDATTTSETIKLAENIAKEQAMRKLDGSVQDSIGLPDGNFKDNFAVQQSPKKSLPHLVPNHLDKGITTIKDEERILKQIGRDGKFGSADHNDLLRQDSSDDDHVDGSFSINRTLKPPQNSAGEGKSKNNTPSISSDSGVIKDSMTEDGVSKDIIVEPPTNKTTSTVIEKDYGSSRKNVDSTDKTYSAKYESPSKQSEKPFTEEANERFDDVASTSTTEAARYKIVIEKLPPKKANNSKDDKNVPQSSKKPFATANAKDAILQHINNVIPKLLDEGESTTAKALPNTKVSANTNPDKQQLRKHDNSDSINENENGDSKDSNNTEPGTSYSVNPGADTAGIYKSDEYESKTEDRIYKRDIPVSLTIDAGPLNRKKSLTEVDVAGKQGLARLTRSNDDKRYDTLSSKYIADEADHVQPGIGIIQSKVNRSSTGAARSALTNRDLAKKSKSKGKHYASETAHGRYKRAISLGENEAEPLNLRKPLIEAKFDDDGKWDLGRSTRSNDKRYDTLSSKYIAEEADHVQPGIGIIQSKVNSSSSDVPKSGLTIADKAKKSNSMSEQFESEPTDHKYTQSIAVRGENAAEPLSFRESLSEANLRDAEGPKRSPDDKRYDTLSSKYIAEEADHVQPGIGIIQSKVNSSSRDVPKSDITNTDKAKKSNSKSEQFESETADHKYKPSIAVSGENAAEPLSFRESLSEAKFRDAERPKCSPDDKRYDTLSSKYIAEEADHVQPGIGIIQSKVNSRNPDVPKSGLTNTEEAKKSNSKSEQFESETAGRKHSGAIAFNVENAAEPLSFRESLSEANFRDAEGPKRSPDDKRYDTLSSKYIADEADHVQPGIGIIQSKVNSRSPDVPKCGLTNTDKAKKSNSKSEGTETELLSPKNEEEFPGKPYPSVARDETDIGIQANMYNNPELPPPALPILMIKNEIDSETNEQDADVTKFLMKGTGKEFTEFAAKYKPPNDDIRELDIYSHERKSSRRRRQCPGCRSGKVKKVKKVKNVQSEEETTVVSDVPSEEVTTVTEPFVVELTVNVDVVHNPEAPPPPLPLREIMRGIQDGSFDGLVEKLEQATDELDIYHHEYVSSTSEQSPAS